MAASDEGWPSSASARAIEVTIAIRMTESAAPVVLAALPYAERQLIVVVADALVAAEREAEKGPSRATVEPARLRLRK